MESILPRKGPVIAQLVLLMGLLGASGLGRYHNALHIREIAGVCTITLFLWLAFTTPVKRSGILPMLIPVVVPGVLAVLFAYVFVVRTGNPLLPSLLAQRDLVFFLIAPAIYMLHARGWGLEDFRRVFVSVATLIVAYYVASYFTVDAQSWLNSGDPYKESMVVYDGTRGYRLKGPLFVVLFLALYFGAKTFRTASAARSGLYFAAATFNVILLAVNLPRSLLFSAIVTLVLYGIFLKRANRISLLAILGPALVIFAASVFGPMRSAFGSAFRHDWSYMARVETMKKAWYYFQEFPLFGFGQDSNQTVSFQDLFGHQFFPQDVGLLGVAFKFGLVGSSLYLLFTAWLFVSLLKMLWSYDLDAEAEQRTFVWALFATCLTIIVAAPMQATFIYGEGIPIGAVAWGLVLAHKHGSPGRLRENPGGASRDALPGLRRPRLG